MGRLRVLSGREVCRILQQHGFAEVRRRGSHVVMQRPTDTGSPAGSAMRSMYAVVITTLT